MATTNGINYNQTRGLLLSTNGKNRIIVSTGGTTTFTGDTNGGTVLSVSGTNGNLLSVVDTNTGTLLEVLDSSNNFIFQVGTVDKIKISGLTQSTDPNVLTIDSSGVVHTSSFINGSGTNNQLAYFSASGTVSSLTTGTYPSLTELSYVKGVTSAIQTQLNGKQATLTNPVVGTGTTNQLSYFTASNTIASLSTTTYPSLTELSYVKGVTSSIQTQIDNRATISQSDTDLVRAYQGIGSPIKGLPVGLGLERFLNTATLSPTTQRLQLIPIFIANPATITGAKWYQNTQGSYTASAYNGIGLYSYNTATDTATLVASSTNDGNIWKNAVGWANKAFTIAATITTPGMYYLGFIYSSSAVVTPPLLSALASYSVVGVTFDFVNSGKLTCHIATQTTLPSTWSHSANTTSNAVNVWFHLY